ncbi:hypothetical protein [Halopseudomonas pertucinogena]|uniref:hypothetical protein n=1 Tax=Halopseudomonas pertucinogena TaxID=86175 RepID=UPI001669939A|nr:hypothetical protein [Halopseudomonas pertucinogena]
MIVVFAASLASILIACLAFALGASLGASAGSVEMFLSVTVPTLAAIGGWVSGIGALAAVFATIRISARREAEDSENLRLQVRTLLHSDNPHPLLGLTVTSTGKRPIVVTSVVFQIDGEPHVLQPSNLVPGSERLPKRMVYGEQFSQYFYPRLVVKLFEMYEQSGQDQLKAKAIVESTTRQFEVAIAAETLHALICHYRENQTS